MKLSRFVYPILLIAVSLFGQARPEHDSSISNLQTKTQNITPAHGGDSSLRSDTSAASDDIAPDASARLSRTSVNFGTWTVNIQQKEGILLTLTNTGNVPLNIYSISLAGADSVDFFQENLCPSSIPAGGSCTITVGFTPTTIGRRTAALTVTDNASNSPQTAKLEGIGTYIQLPGTFLDFGNVAVGTTSVPANLMITNKGSVAVRIARILLTGADPGDFSQTNTCGSTLAAGASCTITVTFAPTIAGSRSASVSIYDNGGGSPQKISLSGTGT